jgi:putative FmdB family regulatory protein
VSASDGVRRRNEVPTYEYACAECGERLEAVQKFTDDPLTVCPACGGRLRKLFSAVGIVFKGSGFYRTDSRSSTVNGTKDKQLNGSSPDSPAAGEKSSGADAKPSGPGSESPVNGAKSQKKAGSGDSGTSSSTGTKVA